MDYADRLREAGFTVKIDPFVRELDAAIDREAIRTAAPPRRLLLHERSLTERYGSFAPR